MAGGAGGTRVESGVHAVGTRWAAAQLDAARALCRALTRPLAATPHNNQQRGFTFMYDEWRWILLCVLVFVFYVWFFFWLVSIFPYLLIILAEKDNIHPTVVLKYRFSDKGAL